MSTGKKFTAIAALICVIQIAKAQTPTTQVIVEPSRNVYVQVGSSFHLVCTDRSPPEQERKLIWKHGSSSRTVDIDAVAGSNFFIEGNSFDNPKRIISTLEKKDASLSDAGSYICQRENDGLSGFQVLVTVIKVSGDDLLMVKGDSNTLQCSATNLTGKSPTWFKDGKEIVDKEDKYLVSSVNNTLTILKADYDDIGPYVCQYKSGNEVFNHTVNLKAAPHVKHFDRSKNLVQGDNLLLQCHASGFPTPVVRWYKGDEQVMESPRVSFENDDGVENATLRIKDLTFDDRAEYMCEAWNNLGVHNSTIIVRVKDKLAALWPFLGICAEVAILCLIIFIYERRRAKKLEEEEMQENATHDMTNSNDHKGKDEVRQRK